MHHIAASSCDKWQRNETAKGNKGNVSDDKSNVCEQDVSKDCSFLPAQAMTHHVRVVNSISDTADRVPVSCVRSVDFPTDGKPTRPILVSPDLLTSNPRPASLDPADLPPGPLMSSDLSLAILALSVLRRWRGGSVRSIDKVSQGRRRSTDDRRTPGWTRCFEGLRNVPQVIVGRLILLRSGL